MSELVTTVVTVGWSRSGPCNINFGAAENSNALIDLLLPVMDAELAGKNLRKTSWEVYSWQGTYLIVYCSCLLVVCWSSSSKQLGYGIRLLP